MMGVAASSWRWFIRQLKKEKEKKNRRKEGNKIIVFWRFKHFRIQAFKVKKIKKVNTHNPCCGGGFAPSVKMKKKGRNGHGVVCM